MKRNGPGSQPTPASGNGSNPRGADASGTNLCCADLFWPAGAPTAGGSVDMDKLILPALCLCLFAGAMMAES